jgi:hypothetical protein
MRYSAPYWSDVTSRPFGSTQRATHDPCVALGTVYSSSTLKPLATFMVAGSVAGGSLGAAFAGGWAAFFLIWPSAVGMPATAKRVAASAASATASRTRGIGGLRAGGGSV